MIRPTELLGFAVLAALAAELLFVAGRLIP